jgi:hypothetical protein
MVELQLCPPPSLRGMVLNNFNFLLNIKHILSLKQPSSGLWKLPLFILRITRNKEYALRRKYGVFHVKSNDTYNDHCALKG